MTTLSGGTDPIQMGNWNMNALFGGTVSFHNSTTFDYKASDSDSYAFTGTGFTYRTTTAGGMQLTGGTITGYSVTDPDSHLSYTIGGLNMTVANFQAAASAGLGTFENTIFAGNDTISGSNTIDTLYGYDGDDTLSGGDGNDTLHGNDGNDTIHGGNDDDHIDGGAGSNTVFGDAGDDVFTGGEGSNAFDGGSGTDTVDYSTAAKGVVIDLGKSGAQAIGGGIHDSYVSIETIIGTTLNDKLTGSAGDDDFVGNGGNDIYHLEAGGNDTIDSHTDAKATVYMGANLHAGDQLILAANSTVFLNGDYSAGLTITGGIMGVAGDVVLMGGHSYTLTDLESGTLDASRLGPSDTANISGPISRFKGGQGDDTFTTTGGVTSAVFHLENGGNDTVDASGILAPKFYMGAAFTSGDYLSGGSASTLYLDGDYSTNQVMHGSRFGEAILHAGHSYNFTVAADFVSGGRLTVNATALTHGQTLTWDASAVSAPMIFLTGKGDATITGTSGGDTFTVTRGGNETLSGGGGGDTFTFGSTFNANDTVDGGSGNDTLSITNVIPVNLTLDAVTGNIHNVEKLALGAAQDFHIVVDANYGTAIEISAKQNTGHTFYFDGRAITYAETINSFGTSTVLVGDGGSTVSLNSSGNTVTGGAGRDLIIEKGIGGDTLSGGDGTDVLTGGTGNDVLDGGAGNDVINLQGGFDTLTTGTGNDVVTIGKSDALGSGYTTITDFDATQDMFVYFTDRTNPLLGSIVGVDATVTHGQLDSGANMATELQTALGAAQLEKDHAVVFTPDSGTLAGHSFLIINATGQAGYQTGDFVIELSGTSSTTFTAANFETAV